MEQEHFEDKLEILRRYYGYDSFRDGQAELIDALLCGRDAFGIMPTGGGKSLCYQIPALMMEGITLVVSPLISLMKDQVAALKHMGVPAAYVNTSLTPEQIRTVLKRIRLGQYKIIYVAPERLLTEGFLYAIAETKLSMLAVDEAHCISQWGQDFRPSYLRIAEFLALRAERPVVCAFTATATREVREDVERILDLRNPLRVLTGYDRPNLRFEVLKPRSKQTALQHFVVSRPDKTGIVYCATRKEVETVCQMLQELGVSATRYHAGLSEEERHANQDDFIYDRRRVMVATNAFGMGIDKSNVSYVLHYNMPKSIEAYYQEAGRAGRDGEKAQCVLLYSPGDIRTARYLIQQPAQNEDLTEEEREKIQQRDLARLEAMVGYCNTDRCLRGYILDYFGQEHPALCGNCSNCDGAGEETDITVQAKIILPCVRLIWERLGYNVGATLVVRVLHGSREKRILELHLEELSTYGAMRSISREQIREMIAVLEARGYLATGAEHGELRLTEKARDVLYCGETVKMRVRKQENLEKKPVPKRLVEASGLLEELKALRMKLAREENVPAYIVFSNATLQDMAEKAPTTMDAFLEVSGVGKYKAERYGAEFLNAIREYASR